MIELRNRWMSRLAVLGCPAVALVLTTQAAFSQPGAGPRFEVASVRPNASGPGAPRQTSVGFQPGGRFIATNITVRDLIELAYGGPARLEEARLVGAPAWTRTEGFDIDARAGEEVTPQQFQPLLRALLAERFALNIRQERRELPVYALVLASPDGKLGPRLQQSEDCTAPGNRRQSPRDTTDPARMCGGGGTAGRLTFGGLPLAHGVLPRVGSEVGRIVIDRTGLIGFFDGSLEWTPTTLDALSPGAAPPVVDAPSIFTALEEQLGLKLEPSTAPVEVFVVESVARPSAN